MSKLINPYEISVWDDIWDESQQRFIEKKLAVIGSNEMLSKNKVLEPALSRNVNGVKKFSFKMYKKYFDNETGEEVYNPFIDYLISERKIKLKYQESTLKPEVTWYDFIIKSVVETSVNYLYSFELEDALVSELSKNGFNVVLDENHNNSMGTANELAIRVLEGTDWQLPEEPEKIVQTVEDTLVYLTINPTDCNYDIWHLLDQRRDTLTEGIGEEGFTLTTPITVLGFYSSCRNKPYRFQFIYLDSYDKSDVQINASRVILNRDCQYYFDVVDEKDYLLNDEFGFYLPKGVTVYKQRPAGVGDDCDTTISNWYKGNRYGYAQRSIYNPQLDKYLNIYSHEDQEYYGYTETSYYSANLITNLVSNTKFDSTQGWTGATFGAKKAQTQNVFGFIDGVEPNLIFNDAMDLLANGKFDFNEDATNKQSAYMKLTFSGEDLSNQVVINSGPFDNRTIIGNMEVGSEWALKCDYQFISTSETVLGDTEPTLDFTLGEYVYNSNLQSYMLINETLFSLERQAKDVDGYAIFKVTKNNYSKETFKKNSKVKIAITANVPGEYYVSSMEFFKAIFTDEERNHILIPEKQNLESTSEGIIKKEYVYFKAEDLKNISSAEQLKNEIRYSFPQNDKYKPVFNQGAEKVRSVSASESNYFNILQSIAETFECWLTIQIRRKEDGTILSKEVAFKNYSGQDNYAAFRYGVNLKDITRTYESKNLVTKLIVKNNSNEYAPNGVCSIQKANSNPTGENYIYDFQYYFNTNLLNAENYLNVLYTDSGYTKEDIDVTSLAGYVPKLRSLNDQLLNLNEDLVNTQIELSTVNANYEVAKSGYDAAVSGLEQTEMDFDLQNNLNMRNFSKVTQVELKSEDMVNMDTTTYQNCVAMSDFKQATLNQSQGVYYLTTTGRYLRLSDNLIGETRTLHLTANKTYQMQMTVINNTYSDVEQYMRISFYPCGISTDVMIPMRGADDGINTTKKVMFGEKDIWEFSSPDFNINNCILRIEFIGTDDYPWLQQNFTIIDIKLVEKSEGVNIENAQSTDSIWGKIATKADFNKLVLNRSIYNQYGAKLSENQYQSSLKNNPQSWYTFKYDFKIYGKETASLGETYILYLYPKIQTIDGRWSLRTEKISIQLTGKETVDGKEYPYGVLSDYIIQALDTERSDIKRLIQEAAIYTIERNNFLQQHLELEKEKTRLDNRVLSLKNQIELLSQKKQTLNQLFYSHYSRFIQEGTWIDEQYTDDEKYYIDAQSVLYNSCYPQVAYTLNVMSLGSLPGYEHFTFQIGDKTYVEDENFFGTDLREEVIISELVNYLEDPSQDQIRVQNFKNQFQDLFQKITATVQQTQYSTGAYQKAAALAEADQAKKEAFLTDALSGAASAFKVAGQQSVVQGADGITITDMDTPTNALKMIGGAIMLSKGDANGEQKWMLGLTADGLAANLLTAGTINTGEISIMNNNEPVFRWDAFGLTAYDANWYAGSVSDVNVNKFVRFDKNGIYGVNGLDGAKWYPENMLELEQEATFSLTWDGLKVTGQDGLVARIGKSKEGIINITKEEKDIFKVTDGGDLFVSGNIQADGGYIGGQNGWVIEDSLIVDRNKQVGLYCGSDMSLQSLVDGSNSDVRFYCGYTEGSSSIPTFCVLADGSLYATAANLMGENVILNRDINIKDSNGTLQSLGNIINSMVSLNALDSELQKLGYTKTHEYWPHGGNLTSDGITGKWYQYQDTERYYYNKVKIETYTGETRFNIIDIIVDKVVYETWENMFIQIDVFSNGSKIGQINTTEFIHLHDDRYALHGAANVPISFDAFPMEVVFSPNGVNDTTESNLIHHNEPDIPFVYGVSIDLR